jgi:hypothetical protein
MNLLLVPMNRAFGADIFGWLKYPEALPQAGIDNAPLALNMRMRGRTDLCLGQIYNARRHR